MSEHVSTSWDANNLTCEQVQYAAKDVYGALSAYDVLSGIPLLAPLAPDTPPLTSVLLFNDDNSQVIA